MGGKSLPARALRARARKHKGKARRAAERLLEDAATAAIEARLERGDASLLAELDLVGKCRIPSSWVETWPPVGKALVLEHEGERVGVVVSKAPLSRHFDGRISRGHHFRPSFLRQLHGLDVRHVIDLTMSDRCARIKGMGGGRGS